MEGGGVGGLVIALYARGVVRCVRGGCGVVWYGAVWLCIDTKDVDGSRCIKQQHLSGQVRKYV